MSQRRSAVAAALILCACGTREGTPPASVATPGVDGGRARGEEALRVSDSVSVWFASARADTAPDGTTCLERVMEIRTNDRTVPIPLLYTGEIPTITSDSTIDVHIWRHCIPADRYRVNLRSGQPVRVEP